MKNNVIGFAVSKSFLATLWKKQKTLRDWKEDQLEALSWSNEIRSDGLRRRVATGMERNWFLKDKICLSPFSTINCDLPIQHIFQVILRTDISRGNSSPEDTKKNFIINIITLLTKMTWNKWTYQAQCKIWKIMQFNEWKISYWNLFSYGQASVREVTSCLWQLWTSYN